MVVVCNQKKEYVCGVASHLDLGLFVVAARGYFTH